MLPVEMLNVPLVVLPATITDVGAVRIEAALFVIVTVVPPVGAACDKVTEHDVPLFEERLLLVQTRDVTEVV
jgi:hypothetical protein